MPLTPLPIPAWACFIKPASMSLPVVGVRRRTEAEVQCIGGLEQQLVFEECVDAFHTPQTHRLEQIGNRRAGDGEGLKHVQDLMGGGPKSLRPPGIAPLQTIVKRPSLQKSARKTAENSPQQRCRIASKVSGAAPTMPAGMREDGKLSIQFYQHPNENFANQFAPTRRTRMNATEFYIDGPNTPLIKG